MISQTAFMNPLHTSSHLKDSASHSFTTVSSSYSSNSSSMTLCNEKDLLSTWIAVKKELVISKPQSCPSAMEIKFHELAIQAVSLLIEKYNTNDTNHQKRVVIVIGGTPGSGKSTLANRVSEILNQAYSTVLMNTRNKGRCFYSMSNISNSTISSDFSYSYSDDEEVAGAMDNSSPRVGSPQTLLNSTAAIAIPRTKSAVSCVNVVPDINSCDATATAENTHNIPTLFTHNAPDLGLDVSEQAQGLHRHDNQLQQKHYYSESQQDKNFLNSFTSTTPANDGSLSSAFATTVPMDGYHYTRSQLDQFPNPREAHARRGAPWTFDAEGVVSMVHQLHDSTTLQKPQPLLFPSFDHAAKDPLPNGVVVDPSTRIVLLEGLYTLLDIQPWNQISVLADMTWCVKVPLDVIRLRLARRHLASGIVSSLKEGYDRVDSNDSLNAQYIMDHSVCADCNVPSIQDVSYL